MRKHLNQSSKKLIEEALASGVPLHQIEAYLDWRELLEQTKSPAERETLLLQGFFQSPASSD